MDKSYWQLLQQSLFEMFHTDAWKYTFITGIAAAGGIWVTVALNESGMGTWAAMSVHGMRSFAGFLIVLFMGVFVAKRRLCQRVWHVASWVAAVSWLLLAYYGFSGDQSYVLLLTMLATSSGFMVGVSLFADSMHQVQDGQKGSIKLALFMIVLPVSQFVLISGAGVLAEINFSYVMFVVAMAYFWVAIIWRHHAPLHTALIDTQHFWQKMDKKQWMLLFLGAWHNILNTPIKFVILPLYFYDKLDKDIIQLGFFLGVLGLLAILGSSIKHVLKGQKIGSYPLLIVFVTATTLCSFLWGCYADVLWVATLMVVFKQMLAPVWSYAFFVEYRACAPERATLNNQRWQLVNTIFLTIGFFIFGFLADDLLLHVPEILMGSSLLFAAYLAVFVVVFPKVKA